MPDTLHILSKINEQLDILDKLIQGLNTCNTVQVPKEFQEIETFLKDFVSQKHLKKEDLKTLNAFKTILINLRKQPTEDNHEI